MRQFAEEEVIIPDGPFAGQRFRADRQPFGALWFDEVDAGIYPRHATTGPTQTGKTLMCAIIPVMYHLFELRETVIFGLPNMNLATDKWQSDIRPAILASRYADQIPASGLGSKNGKIVRIQFKDGQVLRFMSGGGGDENRSAFTSRVLVVTETDKMDEQGGGSREADKITQLEHRTDAYGERRRIYLECTVSIEQGRIWQEIKNGTDSRIVLPCPHCRHGVTPEREHLVGWRDAADVITAGEQSALCCPDCGATWTEGQRVEANRNARLLHAGQTINGDGSISGAPARTDTLGFRWTCVNNLLAPISMVGQDEWKALRAADEDNAEQALLQFKWARPYKPKGIDDGTLDYLGILKRTVNEPKGRVPSDAEFIVTTIDVGKFLCHWGTFAMRSDRTPHVVEYGLIEVPSASMDEKRALLLALREFRDTVLEKGWESDGGQMHPELMLVDEGYLAPVVRTFCSESGGLSAGYAPAKGFGITQYLKQSYHHPRKVSETVAFLGDQYHLARISAPSGVSGGRIRLFDINADHWKSKLHAALRTPIGVAGGLTLHQASIDEKGKPRVNDHLKLAKHYCAERPEEKFIPGEGRVIRWRALTRNNHYLDQGAMAMVALDYVAGRREKLLAAGDRSSSRTARTPATSPLAAMVDDASAGIVEDGEVGSEAPAAPAKQGWFGNRKKR